MPKSPAAKKKSTSSKKKAAAPITAADPRYPIGKFTAPAKITPAEIKRAIATISALPAELRAALRGLGDKKLDTPYREGGWTVRQLVHHVADSHSTAVFRVHKALTEDTPTVEGYSEAALAKLTDYNAPITASLSILDGTHARWTLLLKSLKPKDFARSFKHAERGPMTIGFATLLYAWHSKHHIAHITTLRKQKSW